MIKKLLFFAAVICMLGACNKDNASDDASFVDKRGTYNFGHHLFKLELPRIFARIIHSHQKQL